MFLSNGGRGPSLLLSSDDERGSIFCEGELKSRVDFPSCCVSSAGRSHISHIFDGPEKIEARLISLFDGPEKIEARFYLGDSSKLYLPTLTLSSKLTVYAVS